MGSYGQEWMDCCWCGKWEKTDYHTDVDRLGVLCPSCYHYGPPHYEYLRGMLENQLPERILINIAAFAYEPCAITELAALDNGFTNEDDFECDFCDSSWLGWHCQYCLSNN